MLSFFVVKGFLVEFFDLGTATGKPVERKTRWECFSGCKGRYKLWINLVFCVYCGVGPVVSTVCDKEGSPTQAPMALQRGSKNTREYNKASVVAVQTLWSLCEILVFS
jgi:hypothetical protein